MHRTKLAVLAIAMGCGIHAADARAQSGMPVPSLPPVVSAVGRGEAHAAADHATLVIAVETRGATASAAAAANASAMTATLAALHRIGVRDADLTTSGFSVTTDYLRPVTTPGMPPTITFVARNGVHVTLTTLGKLGTIIDTALAAGATQIGQPQFTSSRIEDMRRTALAQAVERAHADAEAIARAAGGSLGELIEMSTPGAGPMPFYEQSPMYGFASVQVRGVAGGVAAPPPPPTPLAPSDVTVAVTVTARWRFVPGR